MPSRARIGNYLAAENYGGEGWPPLSDVINAFWVCGRAVQAGRDAQISLAKSVSIIVTARPSTQLLTLRTAW